MQYFAGETACATTGKSFACIWWGMLQLNVI
jgi:hypothetical protein